MTTFSHVVSLGDDVEVFVPEESSHDALLDGADQLDDAREGEGGLGLEEVGHLVAQDLSLGAHVLALASLDDLKLSMKSFLVEQSQENE